MDDIKWGVKRIHLKVYSISFIISIALLFCIFIKNCDFATILFSIGASGVASSLVGYFVDLANTLENRKTREKNLQVVKEAYLLALEKYIKNSFIIMKAYENYNKANLYKFKIKNFKSILCNKFINYDSKQSIIKNDTIICDWGEYQKHKQALGYANNTMVYINKLRDSIKNLLKQGEFVLLNYYSQNDINTLKNIEKELDENITCLEMFYYIFDVLMDTRLLQILDFGDMENCNFYIHHNLSGIYDEKDNLIYGRLHKKEIQANEDELFIKDNKNETKI